MSLIRKKEKKNCDLQTELRHRLAHFSQKTERLESAYVKLQEQFYALKKKLEISHRTVQMVFNHMSEGLLFIAKGGTISLFNCATSQIFGDNWKKMGEALYTDIFPDTFFGFSMREALEKPWAHRRIFLSLGAEKELDISAACIPEEGVLLLISDRTEQHKLEKSVQQSERLKDLGEMAATLAHEIRNPLCGIEGFAQLLKRDLSTQSHQHMIRAILEGTSMINGLVGDILDYARPVQLHFASVEIVSFLEEILQCVSTSPNMPTCSFKTTLQNYFLSIDKDKIKCVLLNILRNAYEAEADHVKIELTKEGDFIFSDNGKGISPQHLENIFTPFFTTKARGTGLGLAYSLAIVKAHEGKLEVKSQEGKGTQFILNLK